MRPLARLVLLQLAALGLVLAGLAPWVQGVTGYDLAGAVTEVGGDVDGLPPAWLGWAWYVLPLLGFIAWLTIYVADRPMPRLYLVLGILAALFCVAFVIDAMQSDADLGWGVFLALAAGVLLIVAGRAKRVEAAF